VKLRLLQQLAGRGSEALVIGELGLPRVWNAGSARAPAGVVRRIEALFRVSCVHFDAVVAIAEAREGKTGLATTVSCRHTF
jgi:hypothetical protein